MRRYQRRGSLLVQVVIWLPLVSAVFAVGFGLITSSLRFQHREQERVQDDVTMQHVIRQLRADVGQAQAAQVNEKGDTLQLAKAGGDVSWRFEAPEIVRVDAAHPSAAPEMRWPARDLHGRFAFETLGKAGVVWIRFDRGMFVQIGPEQPSIVATAIAVGGAR